MKTTCWSKAIVSPTLGALGKKRRKGGQRGRGGIGFGDGGNSALGESEAGEAGMAGVGRDLIVS